MSNNEANKNEDNKKWGALVEIYPSFEDIVQRESKVLPFTLFDKISEIGVFSHTNDVMDKMFGKMNLNDVVEREVRMFIIMQYLCDYISQMDEGSKFEVAVSTGLDVEDHFNSILVQFQFQTLDDYIQYAYGYQYANN